VSEFEHIITANKIVEIKGEIFHTKSKKIHHHITIPDRREEKRTRHPVIEHDRKYRNPSFDWRGIAINEFQKIEGFEPKWTQWKWLRPSQCEKELNMCFELIKGEAELTRPRLIQPISRAILSSIFISHFISASNYKSDWFRFILFVF